MYGNSNKCVMLRKSPNSLLAYNLLRLYRDVQFCSLD